MCQHLLEVLAPEAIRLSFNALLDGNLGPV